MANAIYSNARAKYQENFLLDKEHLSRLTECENYSDALKVLSEVGFAGGVYDVDACDYEGVIRADEEKFYSFIKDACPSEIVKEYLLAPFDFHNAEALIRAKHLKIEVDKLIGLSGTIDVLKLKEKIFSDSFGDLPNEIKGALILAEEKLSSGSRSGAEISLIFKTALYKRLYALSVENPILKEIHSAKVDSINVSTALRSRDYKIVQRSFIEGGDISLSQLKFFAEEGFDTLKERTKQIKSRIDVSIAVDAAANLKPLSEFERLADGYALKHLKKRKYEQSGIVPFLYYSLCKKAEYVNVRIILSGILNGLSSTDIKRRLREAYEG